VNTGLDYRLNWHIPFRLFLSADSDLYLLAMNSGSESSFKSSEQESKKTVYFETKRQTTLLNLMENQDHLIVKALNMSADGKPVSLSDARHACLEMFLGRK